MLIIYEISQSSAVNHFTDRKIISALNKVTSFLYTVNTHDIVTDSRDSQKNTYYFRLLLEVTAIPSTT